MITSSVSPRKQENQKEMSGDWTLQTSLDLNALGSDARPCREQVTHLIPW